MHDVSKDVLKHTKVNGDSKADYFFPTALEKVANIFTEHLSKLVVVHIKADLAVTTLRERLDQDVCDGIHSKVQTKLTFMIKKSKAALTEYLHTVLKAAEKAATASKSSFTSNQYAPRYSAPPPAHSGPLYAMPTANYFKPQETCKAFARGFCRFGSSCKFAHEQGHHALPPRPAQPPAAQAAPPTAAQAK